MGSLGWKERWRMWKEKNLRGVILMLIFGISSVGNKLTHQQKRQTFRIFVFLTISYFCFSCHHIVCFFVLVGFPRHERSSLGKKLEQTGRRVHTSEGFFLRHTVVNHWHSTLCSSKNRLTQIQFDYRPFAGRRNVGFLPFCSRWNSAGEFLSW